MFLGLTQGLLRDSLRMGGITLLLLTPAGFASQSPRVVTVDCTREAGVIAPIHGTNSGPLIRKDWNPPLGNPFTADFTQRFDECAIPSSRMHAEGPGDMERIWKPWPNYAGEDPDDPANYDWTITDERIDATYATKNTEVIFRFGHTRARSSTIYSDPPDDPVVFGKVCRNILRHYREGWDNGRYYDLRLTEVWNEPIVQGWFTGTVTDYFWLYEGVWREVNAWFGDRVVVSAALSNKGPHEPWIDEFFRLCETHGVQIDAVSSHWYRQRPSQFLDEMENWRTYFEDNLYDPVPVLVTEWNRNIRFFCRTPAAMSFLACSLYAYNEIYQPVAITPDSTNTPMGVAHANYYSAREGMWTDWNAYMNPGLLWGVYGQWFFQDAPVRLVSEGSFSHTTGVATGTDFCALAGRAEDGKAVNVLLSSYKNTAANRWPNSIDPADRYRVELHVDKLPWGSQGYRWERWVHRRDRMLDLVEEGHGLGADLVIDLELFENTYEVIRIAPLGQPGHELRVR